VETESVTEPRVRLVNRPERLEEIISLAGKLCYSASSIGEVMNKASEEPEKMIDKLMSLGHNSVFEHVGFTFAIEDISRVLTHQLVRHRISSFSQQSQRYVRERDNIKFIIPERVKNASYNSKRYFEDSVERSIRDYHALTEELINTGYTEKEAIEDARYLLPNAMESKMVFTMNIRSLMNFFELRLCNRAQKEIRVLAEKMLFILREEMPNVFNKIGAPCTYGDCPEGKMSCGVERIELRVDNN